MAIGFKHILSLLQDNQHPFPEEFLGGALVILSFRPTT